MILPILRLVLIYFLLVAGVVAVFNRDKLAPLLPGARDRDAVAETASADAPAPLAGGPETEPDPTEAPDATTRDDAGPVFPEPTALEVTGATAPDGTAEPAPAPPVPPAPGAPSPQPAPADIAAAPAGGISVADGQGGPAAPFPPAPEATADAPAQPAIPGAPAPLGTPVATAPAADADPVPRAAASSASDAASAPEAPQAPLAPEEPVAETSPPAPADLTAPTPEPMAPAGSPADSGEPDGLADAIASARAAYWSGDIEGARARMNALAEAHPDNPEVAGELGNLAFALRDYPAAAAAWHRAGLLLIDRGESARVMSFLPFLQSIAPDKAAELAARLQDR